MSAISLFQKPDELVAAGSTPEYTGILQDASGAAIGSGVLSSLTLSITDDATGAVVNACNAQNILNADRGTLDANGNLAITLLAADTAILRAGDARETRSLTIDWAWPVAGRNLTGRHRVILTIVPMPGA